MSRGKNLGILLDTYVTLEEMDTADKNGVYTAKYGKIYKVLLTVGAVLSLGLGLPMFFFWNRAIGGIFTVLGVLAVLIIPTCLSYRCDIDRVSMKEQYVIVFVPVKKEIFWKDVRYRKIVGSQNPSVTFYDKNKKKLIAFDNAIVGFRYILKASNRGGIGSLQSK